MEANESLYLKWPQNSNGFIYCQSETDTEVFTAWNVHEKNVDMLIKMITLYNLFKDLTIAEVLKTFVDYRNLKDEIAVLRIELEVLKKGKENESK